MTRHYLKFLVSVAMATTVHRHLSYIVRHTLHGWAVVPWFIVIPGRGKIAPKYFNAQGRCFDYTVVITVVITIMSWHGCIIIVRKLTLMAELWALLSSCCHHCSLWHDVCANWDSL